MFISPLLCNTVVVGLGHKSHHGKDTAAQYLTEEFGDRFDIRRYSFGDAVKAEFYDVLLQWQHPYWVITDEYLSLPHPMVSYMGREYKIHWIDERKDQLGDHLQRFGTDYQRTEDPFYWIKAVSDEMVKDRPQVAVITDLRFANECYFVKALKGYTVKVTRTGYVNPRRNHTHSSERELERWLFDFEISVGEGALAELRQDVREVFQQIIDRQMPCLPEFEHGVTQVLRNNG